MGRFFCALASLLFLSVVSSQAQAQAAAADSASATPNASGSPKNVTVTVQKNASAGPKGQPSGAKSRLEELRHNFENLPQEEQQKFLQSVRTAKSPTPGNAKNPTPNPGSSAGRAQVESPRLGEFRHNFEHLPQDEQHQFLVNLHRWEAMSSDERERLRQVQRDRIRQQEEDAFEAYQKSGLHLGSEAQRQVFRKRYVQERKRLETQLYKELQEKRQAGNTAIIDELKKEFLSVSPSPTPR